ncbi:hypothetical protein [Schlesneria sp.]|uniref:hypothetical protein n=1 Tax=Schlesneria sp. TaxID=2762018 RepID=UPI002F1DC157
MTDHRKPTIANTSAECLDVGKTDLFVSEKATAFEDVKKRLDPALAPDDTIHRRKAAR